MGAMLINHIHSAYADINTAAAWASGQDHRFRCLAGGDQSHQAKQKNNLDSKSKHSITSR
ncbi:MAG: hypothetical protein EBZ18_05205 [Alphaproteobacteria bacterium]|nr:hypothetical protein [Alphaproteobacteria bacterium]